MKSFVLVCSLGLAVATFDETTMATEAYASDNGLVIQEDYMLNDLGSGSGDRRRRDVGRKFNRSCCGQEGFQMQFTDNEKDIIAACKESATVATMPTKSENADIDQNFMEEFRALRQKMICTYDCFFKNMSLVDSSGNIDQAKFQDYISTKFKEAWQNDLARNSVETCNRNGRRGGGSTCNVKPMMIKKCIRHYIEMNCPADKRVSSPWCDRKRRMQNGPNPSEHSP